MTTTLLRRKKAKMYGIAPSGDDYYAFWSDGRAGLYIDGTFVSYRPGGSGGGPSIPDVPSLIPTDSEALVGDGSIAYRVDATNLQVWDVEGEATHDYAVPAGWVTTPVAYADGRLWWVEHEAVQHGTSPFYTYFRLRKARTDFSEVETVYTHEVSVMAIGFSVDWDWSFQPRLALTAAGAICQANWHDNINGEVIGTINVRIERDGGGGSDSENPYAGVVDWGMGIGLPLASGGSALSVSGFLAALADAVDASPIALWSGAEWELYGPQVSVSADGTQGTVYNTDECVRGPASAGTPTKRFTVGPSPAADGPAYFFIKG